MRGEERDPAPRRVFCACHWEFRSWQAEGMQLDNRISWVDIVAIAGMVLTGALVFFDVKEDVSLNAQKIEDVATDLAEDIERIESESDQDREEILEAVHQIRDESAAGQRRLEDKLDRLIERELEKQ